MTESKEDLRIFLISSLGSRIQDVDEEIFSLFSEVIPSQNLGFVNSGATSVQVDIAGHDYDLMQSPGLLNSDRKGGTTGAVLWKVSPAVARWLLPKENILWVAGVLHQGANVVELGCGIAGVIGLSLHAMISTYLLTDQDYVLSRLQGNIDANARNPRTKAPRQRGKLKIASLDWEADSVSKIRSVIDKHATIDLVIACDCIYNDFLISPFVEACRDVCRLSESGRTLLLIAQQLRSDDVISKWLSASMQYFDIWRVPDNHLSCELASGSGFALHLLLLKDDC